ncbi:MAG: hypothetical protein AB3N10_15720, partial [Allomuricauda sp.]
DYRKSQDYEDIMKVLDKRTNIVEEIKDDENNIKEYLQYEIQKIMDNPFSTEIISCHVHPLVQVERIPIIRARISNILSA